MPHLLGVMDSYAGVLDWAGSNVVIDGITPAWQQVLPGFMYVALGSRGKDSQGRINQALLQGAVAVLAEWAPDDLPESLPWGTFTYVRVLNATSAWYWLCGNWGRLCRLGSGKARC